MLGGEALVPHEWLVDELTADVVFGGQVADRCRFRQRQDGQINSVGIKQLGCGASGWIHV